MLTTPCRLWLAGCSVSEPPEGWWRQWWQRSSTSAGTRGGGPTTGDGDGGEGRPTAPGGGGGCVRGGGVGPRSERLEGVFDTVVDTYGLCSYQDPVQALRVGGEALWEVW